MLKEHQKHTQKRHSIKAYPSNKSSSQITDLNNSFTFIDSFQKGPGGPIQTASIATSSSEGTQHVSACAAVSVSVFN